MVSSHQTGANDLAPRLRGAPRTTLARSGGALGRGAWEESADRSAIADEGLTDDQTRAAEPAIGNVTRRVRPVAPNPRVPVVVAVSREPPAILTASEFQKLQRGLDRDLPSVEEAIRAEHGKLSRVTRPTGYR